MTTRILLELQFSRLFLLSYIINHLTWHAARIYEAMKPESKSQAGRRSRSIRLLLLGVQSCSPKQAEDTHCNYAFMQLSCSAMLQASGLDYDDDQTIFKHDHRISIADT